MVEIFVNNLVNQMEKEALLKTEIRFNPPYDKIAGLNLLWGNEQ